MTNHIYIIVEPGDDASTVSELIKRLTGRHAAFANKQEGRSGVLWEGRFKASHVQRNAYFLFCCAISSPAISVLLTKSRKGSGCESSIGIAAGLVN